jgi:hypothetical protein
VIDNLADTNSMIIDHPNATYWDPSPTERLEARTRSMTNNTLTTPVSDRLLQRLRDFLNSQADMVTGGTDPAQEAEPNAAMLLLVELDAATDGEFAR